MTTTDTTALDLDAIRRTIPAVYDGPWYVQLDDDGRWKVGYPTDNPKAGRVATVPDYGEQLAEFIAAARTAVPALLAEVERLRAQQPTAAPAGGRDINLHTWCARIADAYRDFEQHELAMYPDDDSRDTAIVEWVVRVLGNPELAESRAVLAVLAARHHDELAPTGTGEWSRNRIAELTAEVADLRKDRDFARADRDAIRAELAARQQSATPARAAALQAEPGNNTFVVWYDPNHEPYAVYFRSDANAWDEQRWFNADQMCGDPDGPSTWDDLCGELRANNGPHLLAPVATHAQAVAR